MPTARLLFVHTVAFALCAPVALADAATLPGHPAFGALSVIALMSAVIGAFWGERRLLVLTALSATLLMALISVDDGGQKLSGHTLCLATLAFAFSLDFTRRTLASNALVRVLDDTARALEVILVIMCVVCLLTSPMHGPVGLGAVAVAGFATVALALIATALNFSRTRWRPALILHSGWLLFAVVITVVYQSAPGSALAEHGHELAATGAVFLFGLAFVDQQMRRGRQFGDTANLKLTLTEGSAAQLRTDRKRRDFAEDVARLVDDLDPDLYEESITQRFLDYLSSMGPVAAAAVVVSHRGNVRLVVAAHDPVREEFESILATREELLQSVCLSDRAAVIHSDDLGVSSEPSTPSCLGIVPVRASRNEWAGVLLARSGELQFGLDELELVGDFAHQAYDALRSAQKFRRVKRQAETDALTGVFNRGAVMARGQRAFRKHRSLGAPLSILFVDIDHFKNVNDRLGHSAGDAALAAVAKLCAECLRDGDFLGRYGGEEFLAVLPGTSGREATLAAERLRIAVDTAAIAYDNTPIHLTVCVGIAELTDKFTDFDRMLRAADRALYRAKREGRNRVVHHRYMLRGDRVSRHM